MLRLFPWDLLHSTAISGVELSGHVAVKLTVPRAVWESKTPRQQRCCGSGSMCGSLQRCPRALRELPQGRRLLQGARRAPSLLLSGSQGLGSVFVLEPPKHEIELRCSLVELRGDEQRRAEEASDALLSDHPSSDYSTAFIDSHQREGIGRLTGPLKFKGRWLNRGRLLYPCAGRQRTFWLHLGLLWQNKCVRYYPYTNL